MIDHFCFNLGDSVRVAVNSGGSDVILTSAVGGEGFVSIDGKRTYLNLFDNTERAPGSTHVQPSRTQPPPIIGTGYVSISWGWKLFWEQPSLNKKKPYRYNFFGTLNLLSNITQLLTISFSVLGKNFMPRIRWITWPKIKMLHEKFLFLLSSLAIPQPDAPVATSRPNVSNRRQPPLYRRPTQPPVRIDTCIVGDTSTCDASQHEACATIQGVSACHCKPGYARLQHSLPCKSQ